MCGAILFPNIRWTWRNGKESIRGKRLVYVMLSSSFCESYLQLCLFVFALILLPDQQVSHNHVIMIVPLVSLFGLFRPSSDICVFSFIISTEEESNSSTPLSFDFGWQTSLARRAMREIFLINYMPFSFMKLSSKITFFRGVSRKFRKKEPSLPLSPSNENFTSTWLYNYNNTLKTVRRFGVVQKRFENARKKGESRPPRPLP